MSKPTKHSKKPGAKKIATGAGKRGRKRKGMCLEDRPILEGNAAGIDIGAREIYVAVPQTGMSIRSGYSQPSPRI